ncbi:MAG TPA: hypothetical protein VJL58_02780 [Pyrinomonadaceae bacterium]|nr:hypothetical protein [Pyrinomonadaceae bacterium]
MRFTVAEARRGDGLDVRTLALPPGGKAFLRIIKDWNRLAILNRFGCYKFLAHLEAKSLADAASVAVIIGPHDGSDILDAGTLLERAWIYLNSKGLAVQPYYVVTDQIQRLKADKVTGHLLPRVLELNSAVRKFLNSDISVHMLIRIGYPRALPIRSMRLPLEKVTETASS